MNRYGMDNIRIITPADALDKLYELHCDCGWYLDCGYMWATAEHLYKVHRTRYSHHKLDMIVTEAQPLTNLIIQTKFNKQIYRVTTLRVEPGLT